MADLANGGIVRGDKPPPWSEPEGGSYIPINPKNTDRNLKIIKEAARRLDESGGQ